jgi:nucleotide-binding universal stress UspA family protein
MKWLVGLDLRPEGRGALGFVRWLRDRGPGDDSFIGVHVLEEAPLLSALQKDQLVEVELAVRAKAGEELAQAGLTDVIEPPNVLEGIDADTALGEQSEAHGVDVLLLGRRATSQDARWNRLGRVARRLIRNLPVPMVVVPPDVRADAIGPGPILLASDLGPDSAGAARFAANMGQRLGRQVAVMHILPTFETGASYVPAATVEQLYHQLGMEREKSLEAWKKQHGLQDSPSIVASGDVIGRVVAISREEKAPLVVCGSRRMSTVERIFNASVGSALAAYCTCPVAIVPPSDS